MSTAKSMATTYLNGKRAAQAQTTSGIPSAPKQLQQTKKLGGANKSLSQQRFKSSASNLTQPSSIGGTNSRFAAGQQAAKSQLRSTSMTNLLVDHNPQSQLQSQQAPLTSRIQRPVSRNALDSIHNGMNAKYAQVQSKVAQQITSGKPAPTGSKIPSSNRSATLDARTQPHPAAARATRLGGIQPTAPSGKGAAASSAASERAQLASKVKVLEEEAASGELERESLKRELERERANKSEQMQQLKAELQEKLAEHEKQNEEYHQKLLEAYELADQNRRAADSVLSESRQRDEESRKKIDELEAQLGELREFVAMKDEMRGKLFELREQLREERERYEEQLRNLHQVFANEKISKNQHHQLSDSSFKLDENSNYFSRVKSPALESNESINRQVASHVLAGGCRQCQSGSSQLHRSEQDMYGSKLSTRMQVGARAAWRRSKQFASSVITGSVGGLAGCRQCTSKQMGKRQKVTLNGPREVSSNNKNNTKLAHHNNASLATSSGLHTPEADSVSPRSPSCVSSSSPEVCSSLATTHDDELQHTSVIAVPSLLARPPPAPPAQRSPSPSPRQKQLRRQREATVSISTDASATGEFGDAQHQASSSLIHVDENNKLTIVTKFNDSDTCHLQQQPQQASASSASSERSRCESSSSGRGTSSDAGDSASASQNGDVERDGAAIGEQRATHGAMSVGDLGDGDDERQLQQQQQQQAKTNGELSRKHRRKSLFKASKMFGGSQVSLGKLKSIFIGSNSSATKTKQAHQEQQTEKQRENEDAALQLDQQQQQQQQLRTEHLESSRLRCMELNQAINRAAPAPVQASIELTNNSIEEKDKLQQEQRSEIGGAECEIGQGENEVDARMQMAFDGFKLTKPGEQSAHQPLAASSEVAAS